MRRAMQHKRTTLWGEMVIWITLDLCHVVIVKCSLIHIATVCTLMVLQILFFSFTLDMYTNSLSIQLPLISHLSGLPSQSDLEEIRLELLLHSVHSSKTV